MSLCYSYTKVTFACNEVMIRFNEEQVKSIQFPLLINTMDLISPLSKNLTAQVLSKQNRRCNNAKSFLITAATVEEDK